MNRNWQANAIWPDGTVSYERCGMLEEAQAVCSVLRREGLHGKRAIFPVATWMGRIEDHPRIPDGMLLHLYRAMLDELADLYPRMSDDDPNAPLQRFRVLRAALRNRR
jgi:hypothetical protein